MGLLCCVQISSTSPKCRAGALEIVELLAALAVAGERSAEIVGGIGPHIVVGLAVEIGHHLVVEGNGVVVGGVLAFVFADGSEGVGLELQVLVVPVVIEARGKVGGGGVVIDGLLEFEQGPRRVAGPHVERCELQLLLVGTGSARRIDGADAEIQCFAERAFGLGSFRECDEARDVFA